MPGMPLRGDRIHRSVNAFCPQCHHEQPGRPLSDVQRLSGYLAEDQGKIWLIRACRQHGKITTRYDESPNVLRYRHRLRPDSLLHFHDHSADRLGIRAAVCRSAHERHGAVGIRQCVAARVAPQ